MLKNIKTTMDWLADELEVAGKDPVYAAQQAILRAESVASSKTLSRTQSPVITKQPSCAISPKVRS
ncbi:hypothetical protein AX15_006715 [Amanita polypyramis BW_CC]|nr:hypothetical protein AX15_006715 [Amanita polypyramis BW_CC]